MKLAHIARRCLLTVLVLVASAAWAQTAPISQPIRLIAPYAPGGPVDLIARLLASALQTTLKETVIVENRPGAGSVVGARVVASSPPDGRTILIGNVSTFAIAPATTKNPGYDPIKSFIPLGMTADASAAVVVHSDFAGDNIRDLIAFARANPGKASYSSAGVGNSSHLIGELFQSTAGLELVHVPYRSGADMMTAVLSKQVVFASVDLSAALGAIKKGTLKALAVTGPRRSPELPAVPTLVEAGYPTLILRNWSGAAVPAATPREVAARLEEAIRRITSSADYQAAVARLGAEAKPSSGEEMAALIAADYKRWGDVARSAGITLE